MRHNPNTPATTVCIVLAGTTKTTDLSSLTLQGIDGKTIATLGILYESSQADMVFQKIPPADLLKSPP